MKAIRVQTLLILSIVVTLISAIVTYLSAAEKKESITLVIHTYKVIQASNRLLSLLKDMEIGHRGYLITTDSAFLQPYHEAVMDIDNDMDTLATLVQGDPHQFDVLQNQIIPLVTRKKQSLEESVVILQRHGRDSASHFASMRTAKATMDSIVSLTTSFIEYEQGQLRERSQNLEQRYVIGDFIRFTSFALIGITSLAALVTITAKQNDNKRLLKELQVLNQQLEKKVSERTRELQDANQDLVKLNQEKNHFLAITTHDLKAPLAGISGLLQVMKLDSNTRTPRDIEYIQLMEETCDNMQRLISELLDFSRIEQGTTHLDIRPISITKLFREMEDHFRSWARNKDIDLIFKNELTTATIFTDHDTLVRILDNLISNAIKFSPSRRTVSITAREEGNQLRFDIRDQGPGIRGEERDKLFQRFQTLSARPTNGESSSGLGLSIVKDLVGLLKGSVQVESENGHGSCFIIRLPRSLDEVMA